LIFNIFINGLFKNVGSLSFTIKIDTGIYLNNFLSSFFLFLLFRKL